MMSRQSGHDRLATTSRAAPRSKRRASELPLDVCRLVRCLSGISLHLKHSRSGDWCIASCLRGEILWKSVDMAGSDDVDLSNNKIERPREGAKVFEPIS